VRDPTVLAALITAMVSLALATLTARNARRVSDKKVDAEAFVVPRRSTTARSSS
jgi:hypothetical protein